MKKLWNDFFDPTPQHIKKWQRVLLAFGGLGTLIAAGGVGYDWIPPFVVKAMGTATLLGTFLMQFATEKEQI